MRNTMKVCMATLVLCWSSEAATLIGVVFGNPPAANLPTNWQAAWVPYQTEGEATDPILVDHPGNLFLNSLIDESGAPTVYSLTVTTTSPLLENFETDTPSASSVPAHTPR